MKLPKEDFTVKIGPFIYEVKYSADIAEEGQVFGSTHSNNQNIFLDPNKKPQKIEQTFIHELFHACMFVNGLCYRFALDDKDRRPNEEETIRELSMSFYQVIKDNPELFV